jgi:ankyrin repeat protein
LLVAGDLILSKDIAVIGAEDCDNEYVADHFAWPTGLRLSASDKVPGEQLSQLKQVVAEVDQYRKEGKAFTTSAVFGGRVRLGDANGFPAELRFDSVSNLKVDVLPDAKDLPVIPICDLFQELPNWKGQRIAVRGEEVGTMEGSWLVGRCKGGFYTNGYRWPVSLSYAGPAFYAGSIESLIRTKQPTTPPKNYDEFRGKYNVRKSATYVGRLRMRTEYHAFCRGGGEYTANGFGHLGGAAAEIVVEEIRDVELSKRVSENPIEEEAGCKQQNLDSMCGTASLQRAAALGCMTRLAELLSKDGIDSKNGSESIALNAAITSGKNDVVQLLLRAGAPINPKEVRVWSPLGEAAWRRRFDVMKTLLNAGADVDAVDKHGATYLASYGFFDIRVLKLLLAAGAKPNATDMDGCTALMHASRYGYEDAVVLLLENGALVNLKDNKGRSALMYAATGKYVDAIPDLLSHGADLLSKDVDGRTALDLARSSKNEVAIDLLSAAMRGRN